MRRRVTPVHTQHRYYTNISVCERWDDFQNFLDDMGERPEGMTLDRIDGNGDYCPENCRWATRSEQNKNRRPFTRKDSLRITFNGETLTTPQWAKKTGLRSSTIRIRLKRGWTVEKALTKPPRQ